MIYRAAEVLVEKALHALQPASPPLAILNAVAVQAMPYYMYYDDRAQLAKLMPGRHAKFEASSGLIASIDTYAYRAPRALQPEPEAAPAEAPLDEEALEAAPESESEAEPQEPVAETTEAGAA